MFDWMVPTNFVDIYTNLYFAILEIKQDLKQK